MVRIFSKTVIFIMFVFFFFVFSKNLDFIKYFVDLGRGVALVLISLWLVF